MQILTSIVGYRAWRSNISHQTVGFVPTMGNLHQGHASLLTRSIIENDATVLSIFVNPTQFNNTKDLTNYPRTQNDDAAMAKSLGVDAIFIPEYEMLYPDNFCYQVNETMLANILEGKHRPGHFTGMLTVVMKLLNIVQPKRAYFGEKDYQQLQLVRGMVDAFFMDIDIIACKTTRETDGLAMSSRNGQLSHKQRKLAAQLYRVISSAQSDHDCKQALQGAGFDIDYIETWENRRLAAIKLGNIRLIDNVPLGDCSC